MKQLNYLQTQSIPQKFDVCTVHYSVCIENQHCALGFVNVFITNADPTCFGTYVPSSGSVFVLVSTWKLRQLCTASGNVNLCALSASLWCCTVLCFPTDSRTHKDKDTPWGWHIGAETCRIRISNKYINETQCAVLVFYAYSSKKLKSKLRYLIFCQRCWRIGSSGMLHHDGG
jgi:hypothetical protein